MMPSKDPQKARRATSFDTIARQYDQTRPAYPDALIDYLLDAAAVPDDGRILEVGPGTGKATTLFARRGCHITGLEPGVKMAEIARENCSEFPDVQIETVSFEDWNPNGHRFNLLTAAQSFHWIDLDTGFQKAADVLTEDGAIGLFWNRHNESETSYGIFNDLYKTYVPELWNSYAALGGYDEWIERWQTNIDSSRCFTPCEISTFNWEQSYTSEEYPQLLGTYSDHIALSDDQRTRLFDAVRDKIDSMGGSFVKHYTAVLFFARVK
jgi:SAM-dependent methyltransferase